MMSWIRLTSHAFKFLLELHLVDAGQLAVVGKCIFQQEETLAEDVVALFVANMLIIVCKETECFQFTIFHLVLHGYALWLPQFAYGRFIVALLACIFARST